jgi:glycosyltransferase involved in cell wall biosynthesis
MLCSDTCHIGRKSLGLSANLLNQESFIHYWLSASGLMRRVLLTATSYPNSESDWRSLFIREMVAGLARSKDTAVSYWGPAGPLPGTVDYLASESDRLFLQKLADRGGIAHLMRANPFTGFANGFSLLRRMRRALRQQRDAVDVFHLNWLQSALAIPGNGSRALVTVLGTDYKLLEIPGIEALLRRRFSRNRVALAPNAEWMVPKLEAAFGDLVGEVTYVPLGIDNRFYAIKSAPDQTKRIWLTVLRLTRAKIGPLLEWTKDLATNNNEFHLFGPMQEEMTLPPWIHYHGPVTPDTLIRDWYPQATAMLTLSEHDEGRPQVLLEAMASGLPVIASDLPAHVDLLNSIEGGLIVGNRQEFVAALMAVSANDTHASLSAAARQAIKDTYGSWDDCADRYQSIYDRLMQGTAS